MQETVIASALNIEPLHQYESLFKNNSTIGFSGEIWPIDQLQNHLAKAKTLPKLVIYLISAEDIKDLSFLPAESGAIKDNLARLNNSYWETLFQLLPFTKKVFLNSIRPLQLKNDAKNLEKTTHAHRALEVKLFKYRLEKLNSFLLDSQVKLIFVYMPSNINQIPRDFECIRPVEELMDFKANLKNQLLSDDIKGLSSIAVDALAKLDAQFDPELALMAAQAFYQAQRPARATPLASKALFFNCHSGSAQPLAVSLVRQFARENLVDQIDFEFLLYDNLAYQDLWESSGELKAIYWRKLAELLNAKRALLLGTNDG